MKRPPIARIVVTVAFIGHAGHALDDPPFLPRSGEASRLPG
jgi:hypothetical protein